MRVSTVPFLALSVAFVSLPGCNTGNLVKHSDGPAENEASPAAGAEDRTALSEDAAKEIGASAAAAIARTVMAIRPVSDLQAIYEAGMPSPACPRLTANVQGGNLSVTLDYASGCGPAMWRHATVAGTVTGTYFAAFNSFDLALAGMMVDGAPIEGDAAGSLTASGEAATFALTVNVSDHAGGRVRATVTADVQTITSRIVLRDGTATVREAAGDSYHAVFDGIIMDAEAAAALTPVDGSITLTRIGPGLSAAGASTAVRFSP